VQYVEVILKLEKMLKQQIPEPYVLYVEKDLNVWKKYKKEII
jgi:hypothetical protein